MCPDFLDFVSRYFLLYLFGFILIAIRFVTFIPKFLRCSTFLGLLVINFTFFIFSWVKISFAGYYSLSSSLNPKSSLASTVSIPFSCNEYALSLFSNPISLPSCARYIRIPSSASAINLIDCFNC